MPSSTINCSKQCMEFPSTFFPCPCGFPVGSPVSSTSQKHARWIARSEQPHGVNICVTYDGLVSHPGQIPASRPVFTGIDSGSTPTPTRTKRLLKVNESEWVDSVRIEWNGACNGDIFWETISPGYCRLVPKSCCCNHKDCAKKKWQKQENTPKQNL